LSTVIQNLIANYAGKVWTGIIGLVFVPLYIKFLGIEAYGLIGIYLSLMALLYVLDMGLSATLSRELARLSVLRGAGQEARNLVRTMEVIYWGTGIVIGAGIFLVAPLLTRYWVNIQGPSVSTVEKALKIMGFVAALEWPVALYSGGLMGLQRQVRLNGVRAAMATVQAVGAVLVLWLISPTITAYFEWQILISALQTILLAHSLWSVLPDKEAKSMFRRDLLRKNWRFAAGMTGISVVVTVLTQLDKIILSKMLTLKMFGYYILAFSVAGALTYLVNPIYSALFPRFSQIILEDSYGDLSSAYHKGCQLLSLVVLPPAVTLIFFSKEILMLWIGTQETVINTYSLLSLISIGTTLNCIMTLPYAMQLAYGWTKLSFYKNVIACMVLIPALFLMISKYGGKGAAIVWIILNAAYFLIEIPVMHKRILKYDISQWYIWDVGLPALIIIFMVVISRVSMPHNMTSFYSLIWILSTSFIAFIASGFFFLYTNTGLCRKYSA
jgi:O-antigen/teichoic acid export membrane protein